MISHSIALTLLFAACLAPLQSPDCDCCWSPYLSNEAKHTEGEYSMAVFFQSISNTNTLLSVPTQPCAPGCRPLLFLLTLIPAWRRFHCTYPLDIYLLVVHVNSITLYILFCVYLLVVTEIWVCMGQGEIWWVLVSPRPITLSPKANRWKWVAQTPREQCWTWHTSINQCII